MLRGIAVLMTALMGTGAGFLMAARLKGRRDALETACGCVSGILLAIAHTNRALPDILFSLNGPDVVEQTAKRMEEGMLPGDAWEAALREAGNVTALLTGEDLERLNEFVAVLGKTGRAAQLEHGQMVLSALEKRRAGAEEAYAKKGRVYRTMGAVLGAGLAILLM